VTAVLDFLAQHQAALLWGSGVLLVAGLAAEWLRQVLRGSPPEHFDQEEEDRWWNAIR
jgi:hypothetical protein